MADETLQTQITVLSRAEHVRRYLRSVKLYSAVGTDVGTGSQPDIEARAHGDVAMVLYSDVQICSANTNLIGATGKALLAKAAAVGIDGKLPASGAQGFAIIAAAEGGGTIEEGKTLRHKASGLRYEVTVTDLYVSGQLCPVRGIDTGTATNLAATTVLEWVDSIPGILPDAVVADNGDGLGVGLEGGRPEESDDELIQRIIDLRRNPPTSGNTAAYRAAAKKTPGLAVEAAFATEAVFGPGTVAIAVTMRPAYVGASRSPNPVQLQSIEDHLRNAGLPGDDGIFVAATEEVTVDVAIGVKWTKAALGWANRVPWPPRVDASPVRVSSAGSATHFILETAVSTLAPKPGDVVALYDNANRRFVQKQIGAVAVITAGLKWSVTCTTTANASDTTYVPRGDVGLVPGQFVSPWSKSLNLLVKPMLGYFGRLGPGEVFATFYDEGTRQKRQPESPEEWPHTLSSRDIGNAAPTTIASDVRVIAPASAGVTYSTPIGQPGVITYLLRLGDFAVYVF